MTGLAIPGTRGPAVSAGAVDTASGDESATSSRLYEKGLTLAAMGSYEEAIKTLRAVTVRAPDHAPAWLKLAELLRFAYRDEDADEAETNASGGHAHWSLAVDPRNPAEIKTAEKALRELLDDLD